MPRDGSGAGRGIKQAPGLSLKPMVCDGHPLCQWRKHLHWVTPWKWLLSVLGCWQNVTRCGWTQCFEHVLQENPSSIVGSHRGNLRTRIQSDLTCSLRFHESVCYFSSPDSFGFSHLWPEGSPKALHLLLSLGKEHWAIRINLIIISYHNRKQGWEGRNINPQNL